MIELCSPKEGDLERQKEIWRLCFGDGEEYIGQYYHTRYRQQETLVLKEDGVVRSMLAGLPMELRTADGRAYPAAYIYALATHPSSAGEGFGGYLLKYADFRFREAGFSCALTVPAKPELHRYFARSGFGEAFSHREWTMTHSELGQTRGALRPAEPGEYAAIRNGLLRGSCHVAYDEEAVALQRGFSRLSGADIFVLELPEGRGCAAAERMGRDGVIVKELLAPEGAAALSGAALLAGALRAQVYRFRVPSFWASPVEGAPCAFGMVKWYLPDEQIPPVADGFLGLAYD